MTTPDASPSPDAPPIPPLPPPPGSECNAISQIGCNAGEKCAFILDNVDAGIGHTGCIANGTQSVGQACTSPASVGTSDDCVAGAHCYLSECMAMCDLVTYPYCGSNASCIGFEGLENYDVCLPGCDPITQDCSNIPVVQGCYLTASGSVCSAFVGSSGTGEDGYPCMYLNDCAPGYGCFDDGMGGGNCLKYCGPVGGCFNDAMDEPTGCGCGGCGASDLCLGIQDEETVGLCVSAADVSCDCFATPLCPPP